MPLGHHEFKCPLALRSNPTTKARSDFHRPRKSAALDAPVQCGSIDRLRAAEKATGLAAVHQCRRGIQMRIMRLLAGVAIIVTSACFPSASPRSIILDRTHLSLLSLGTRYVNNWQNDSGIDPRSEPQTHASFGAVWDSARRRAFSPSETANARRAKKLMWLDYIEELPHERARPKSLNEDFGIRGCGQD